MQDAEQQHLVPRTGPHHHYYKDMAQARGIPCPAGGYLQVRQEVITHQFGELLHDLSLVLEPTGTSEEAPLSERVERPREEPNRRTKQGSPETPPSALQNVEQSASSHQANREQSTEEACLAARTPLLDIIHAWPTASPERRRAMVTTLFEPGGIPYDIEKEQLAALVPRAPFAPFPVQTDQPGKSTPRSGQRS